ncbi:hypothetical protein [Ruminococcus flavefaciens]|jgi:hypothetical protein|uniref:Uncharacterized protein n=1 Tax=Ruminococcus flavefaciens TaxID=1265 RepID=A0A1K1NE72_RUMFL|nr:hypothetical protein [Ruminococcus flavefaciens]SFW33659.1 hypothetical protein SAMN02910280_1906 [Ruminococcus flavefaciens]
MNDVKPTKAWSISLITGSISSLIVILTRIAGIQLNDWVRRILGIILLISLPVMVFTSIRMYKKAKNG